MGLTGKAAARTVGYATHEITEDRLIQMGVVQGGIVIQGSCFPGTQLRNYQVLVEYGSIVVGKATIAEVGELPTKNLTRANGVTLNRSYAEQLELPSFSQAVEARVDSSDVPMYVTILTCRDRNNLSGLHEVAVAVIDASFESFIFYDEIDSFIAGYDAASDEGSWATGSVEAPMQPIPLQVRKDVKPFVGGEEKAEEKEASDDKSA